MTVPPIGAIEAEGAAAKQIAQAASQQSGPQSLANSLTPINSVPASVEAPARTSSSKSNQGFVNSVLDGVYNEIDKLGSKLPEVTKQSPIEAYKSSMVSPNDSISPVKVDALANKNSDAVQALSKTFDHAIFMAMVNQVVSGVGDTSRTLIRQT
ncbi:MAG: hypothetical protein AAFW66_00455 [Pseudomonadota bacterium]